MKPELGKAYLDYRRTIVHIRPHMVTYLGKECFAGDYISKDNHSLKDGWDRFSENGCVIGSNWYEHTTQNLIAEVPIIQLGKLYEDARGNKVRIYEPERHMMPPSPDYRRVRLWRLVGKVFIGIEEGTYSNEYPVWNVFSQYGACDYHNFHAECDKYALVREIPEETPIQIPDHELFVKRNNEYPWGGWVKKGEKVK